MKDAILKKAAEMFLKLGFKSVTMDDIAAAMSISKKTIYQHFGTKPELVAASTIHIFETICEGIDAICALNYNPIEEMFAIKDLLIKHVSKENASPIFQLQKYYPEVHYNMREKQLEKMEDCTITNLKKGIEMGLYRADIDVDFIARMNFVGAVAIKDLELFPVSKFDSDELQHKFLNYHLRGIVSEKGLVVLQQLLESKN